MKTNETLTLVNHSSILIEDHKNNFSLLTDPWYNGLAFNNGWSLLYNNKASQILNIISRTKYIYLSHEHPDHFSTLFFNQYSEKFLKNCKVVFQETRDNRLITFLNKKFNIKSLIFKHLQLSKLDKTNFTIIKCGHIDSGFILETDNFFHININDCDFSNFEISSLKKILSKTNKKKILYIQFSYAAYRPGKNWLEISAKRKLNTIIYLYKTLLIDLVIPYASLVYYCHEENFHLNQFMNNCKKASIYLLKQNVKHCFLDPFSNRIELNEIINNNYKRDKLNANSIKFWDNKIKNAQKMITQSVIPNNFKKEINVFLDRIKIQNSYFLLFLIRYISLKFIFGDVIIKITDKKEVFKINFFSVKNIYKPQNLIHPDISMSAESFSFLLNETYGFDTLTVNGRFNQIKKNGYRRFVFSIGFTIFNQSGYGIKFFDLFNKLIFQKILLVPLNILLKKS